MLSHMFFILSWGRKGDCFYYPYVINGEMMSEKWPVLVHITN